MNSCDVALHENIIQFIPNAKSFSTLQIRLKQLLKIKVALQATIDVTEMIFTQDCVFISAYKYFHTPVKKLYNMI